MHRATVAAGAEISLVRPAGHGAVLVHDIWVDDPHDQVLSVEYRADGRLLPPFDEWAGGWRSGDITAARPLRVVEDRLLILGTGTFEVRWDCRAAAEDAEDTGPPGPDYYAAEETVLFAFDGASWLLWPAPHNGWDGFGSRLDQGSLAGALALLRDETGIDLPIERAQLRGVVDMCLADGTDDRVRLRIYRVPYAGDPAQGRWFDDGDIPYPDMWTDMATWLPMLVAGDRFDGTMRCDPTGRIPPAVTMRRL